MKMSKYKYNNNLAYTVNVQSTVTVKRGNIYEGERCQKTEVRRWKTKKKEEEKSEDKRDNVCVTQVLKRKMYVLLTLK